MPKASLHSWILLGCLWIQRLAPKTTGIFPTQKSLNAFSLTRYYTEICIPVQ